ncbi:integrase arm-type DNA-binding domain-containing protein [Stutzerimonas nitrititolerans]|uniref:Arm DNA-binding domain-containing protein n=1 Tax=Stutzerimonas nitrititolerans TaxID=2482751 RepID=UPI003F7FCA4F
MPENLLTDAKIKSVKPADRDWKLSDGGGLFLLVKPTGGKLWRWKYRLQGKENLFVLQAFHVKGDLSAIFEFAVVWGLVEANPIPSLRGLLRAPLSESKAAMTKEQIQKFYQELRRYRDYPETSLCLRLIALTACRPGEAADAE